MMTLVRTLISQVAEGVIKRFSGSGRSNETFAAREYFQHYGFTSSPKAGAEGVAIVQGNVIYLIASDDRRYRVSLADGEVALYTDEGDFVHFKRGNLLHVSTGRALQIDAVQDVEINTARAVVNASQSATISAPAVVLACNTVTMQPPSGGAAAATLQGNVSIQGTLQVTGSISASGTITDAGGNTNHHSHG
ncbi:MAG: phage baseplate assembly protein V [Deltaproteobacteria bacterium]|nr:phage baseplate assembly protein V [Deltaproteobacteria bacterium]